MGAESSIEWTDHTFNIVWGCLKVSDGCKNCYAETLAKRYGFDVWGPAKTTERRVMSDTYWRQPVRWNAVAEKAGKRARVFCCSMADVFEDHPTNERERNTRLWPLIEATPWLDWQLLTKRPENIARMVPDAWLAKPRRNVWYGTSAEDQQRLDERLPHLLAVPAQVRFLSCEPLLGPLDLKLFRIGMTGWGISAPLFLGLHWVIAGGESGPGARPMHPAWARSLRDQSVAAGVAFHFKQWGEYTPYYEAVDPAAGKLIMSEYPNGGLKRVGKHAAGRLLDGREWSEFPQ